MNDENKNLTWEQVKESTPAFQDQPDLASAYISVLSFIFDHGYGGACHDTSAIIFILFSELGFSPELKIGEVKSLTFGNYFDHSWVVLDDSIYDAAIGLPQPTEQGGSFVSGPIFNSIDIFENEINDIDFNFKSEFGLDQMALDISKLTIGEYENMTGCNVFGRAVELGKKMWFRFKY